MPSLTRISSALVFLFVSSTSSAMGVLHTGTNACYAVRNFSDRDIQNVDVVSAENPNQWLEGAAQMRGTPLTIHPNRRDPSKPYSFSAGGACFFRDTGHEVPDAILVSWRSSPLPNANDYADEFVGPYLVEVRSRVPQRVLALARDPHHRYRIGFSITVGVNPVRVNWILEYRHPKPIYAEDLRPFKRIAPHTELLCVGGDSFDPLNLEAFEWGSRPGRAGITVPVWPHCRLL